MSTTVESHARDHEGAHSTIVLRVQTPRGLWSVHEPKHADRRPVYKKDMHVQIVIDDARHVFKFVENDNQYILFHGSVRLDPSRTLGSYHLPEDTLLVLSVQGGNA